jgi:hypothetical protein
MQELITINTTPAAIHANFDEVESKLTEYLRRFDVVVTADSVADAKKLATDLNKQIGELDRRIKDAIAEAGAPIREADERRKQLVKLGQDVRAKIREQVDLFEDATRAQVEQLLNDRREELWLKYGVDDEFKAAEFDDLVKLTSMTKKGRLAKAAADTLDARVRDDKALQDRTERRLSDLTARSYEAGLAAPLGRDHVVGFLFGKDDTYERELQRILDAEIDRQSKAEQRAWEQAEREAAQKVEAERKEAERQQRLADAARTEQAAPYEPGADEPAPDVQTGVPPWEDPGAANAGQNIPENIPDPDPAPERSSTPAVDGKVPWVVVATFELRVPAATTLEEIRAGTEAVMAKAGIKALRNVSAQRKQRSAA